MSRRLIGTVSLALVLSLGAGAARADIAKGLLVHYTFDNADIAGQVVRDVSGNGHDGTIAGADIVTGAPGVFNQAIQFPQDQTQHVVLAAGVAPMGHAPRTFSLWFNLIGLTGQNKMFGYGQHNPGTCVDVAVGNGGVMLYHWGGNVTWGGGTYDFVGANAGWHHLAVRVNDNAQTFADVDMILDGQQLAITTGASTVAINTGSSPFTIGTGENNQGINGLIDDFYLHDRALTDDEIGQLRVGKAPGVAWNMAPADGATDVPRDAMLSWAPGEFANTHDVYLGSASQDIEAADRTSPWLVSRSQTGTTYDPAGGLDFGQTYFWRVDEVNAPPDATVFKGEVWSFTVEPYAYPVTPTAATASSFQADMGPEKTIDGSGLAGDLHGTLPNTMWMTAGALPNWIQYEFDRAYKLYDLQVWNSNQMIESFLGFGARKVTVETSLDGAAWTPVADVPEFARAPGMNGYAPNTTVNLGEVMARYVRLTIDTTWGGVAPQTGLAEVRFSQVPVRARGPQPQDTAANVSIDTTLDWRPGREAASHQVYFGVDPNAVAQGTAPVQTVTERRYTPGTLDLATTYYWRVDEVNAVTYPGAVWSFTTQQYRVVDDFESYTDQAGEEVFTNWADGFDNPTKNGAIVGLATAAGGTFCNTTTVHGGRQSMPLAYDNGTAPLSETTRTFADPQDWTASGIEALVLFFYGDPANTGTELYLKINNSQVVYNGLAGDLALEGWSQWNIDLTALPAATLRSVRTLTIGVSGGAGSVLIDDIRLYRLAPDVPAAVGPGNQ